MTIHGLQKMTLLDFPGRVACTVFLGGCDMRCPFCHNAELIDGSAPAALTEEELLRFLRSRTGLLDGVAVTGGEPTLRADLPAFLGRIREMGYPVKLDTNGMHPERLEELIRTDLVQYVAMDIKNSPERYARTAGLEIGPWIRGARRYFLQKFTDRETVPFEGLHAPEDGQLRAWAELMRPWVGEVSLRGVD